MKNEKTKNINIELDEKTAQGQRHFLNVSH